MGLVIGFKLQRKDIDVGRFGASLRRSSGFSFAPGLLGV